MTPDQHPIRGFVFKVGRETWKWSVTPPGSIPRFTGYEPSLPAAYDRCAAAVTKAREEEA